MRDSGRRCHVSQTSTAARIVENIRRTMYVKRINQTVLAAALGRSQSALSRRMLGQIPFSVDELDRIAVALDVPLTDLFFESEPNTSTAS
jgi:transcriptional regulator with XRE-family HTH domain